MPITAEERGVLIARGLRDSTIDTTFLRESLREAFDERQKTLVGSEVLIHAARKRKPLRYHVDERCHKYPIEDAVKVSRVDAEADGYEPCALCCNLSTRRWCDELGNPASYGMLTRLLSYVNDPEVARIRKPLALRLYLAIGEDPHPSLFAYRATTRKRHDLDDAAAAS